MPTEIIDAREIFARRLDLAAAVLARLGVVQRARALVFPQRQTSEDQPSPGPDNDRQ